VKRFYNGETRQIHRFIPLFQNIDDGKVMGMCMDSDKRNYLSSTGIEKTDYDGKWIPRIRKGQMVLVDKTNDTRVGMSYKGENLFNLSKVYGNTDEGNQTSKDYLSQLWFSYCSNRGWIDYDEMN
jgi:hypothetical protein